jgi:hypothetical protein
MVHLSRLSLPCDGDGPVAAGAHAAGTEDVKDIRVATGQINNLQVANP